jgi:hypothetical protein
LDDRELNCLLEARDNDVQLAVVDSHLAARVVGGGQVEPGSLQSVVQWLDALLIVVDEGVKSQVEG